MELNEIITYSLPLVTDPDGDQILAQFLFDAIKSFTKISNNTFTFKPTLPSEMGIYIIIISLSDNNLYYPLSKIYQL